MVVGDIVYLKSGGPAMTVVGVATDERGQRVIVNWMDNRVLLISGDLPMEAVTLDKPVAA